MNKNSNFYTEDKNLYKKLILNQPFVERVKS